MVRIRLRRVGRKKAPAYRIVVADSKSPRDGKFIEIIGQYAPRASDEQKVTLDATRADYWLSVGAQPSDTVRSILRRAGVLKARHEARLARERQASAVALPEVSSPTAAAAQPTSTETPVAAMSAAPVVAATPESPIDEMPAVASPGVTDAVSDDTVSEGSAPAAEA